MIHAFVIYCMVLNPTMCMKYEIIPDNYEPVASVMHCLMGGVIFSGQHQYLDHNGIAWETKGGVRCYQDPPSASEIVQWVEQEKARTKAAEPQTK